MLKSAPFLPILPASDLNRARDYYAKHLDLHPTQEVPGGLLYDHGATKFVIYETQYAGTAKNTCAGWMVDDLDAEMARLRETGVEFQEYDLGDVKTVDGVADWEGDRSAWFIDSEGNILALNQLAT